MKLGYQDAGSWTLLKSTPVDRRKAAWLYAQFCVSKTVSLKKSHVGLTFIRESDIWHRASPSARRSSAASSSSTARPARVAVDADRDERPGLSEAGAALVAEHRRRLLRREDGPQAGDGLRSARGAGQRAGAAASAPTSRAIAGRS